VTQQRLISLRRVIKRFQVIAWNNQDVGGRLGIDVSQDDASSILEHHVAGRISRQDSAKEAISFSHFRAS